MSAAALSAHLHLYTVALARIVERYEKDLDALGANLRAEVVLPACRKHRLTFLSGSGGYTFYKGHAGKGHAHDAHRYSASCADDLYAWPKSCRVELEAVFKILDQEVARNDYLGLRVGNVTEDDRK